MLSHSSLATTVNRANRFSFVIHQRCNTSYLSFTAGTVVKLQRCNVQSHLRGLIVSELSVSNLASRCQNNSHTYNHNEPRLHYSMWVLELLHCLCPCLYEISEPFIVVTTVPHESFLIHILLMTPCWDNTASAHLPPLLSSLQPLLELLQGHLLPWGGGESLRLDTVPGLSRILQHHFKRLSRCSLVQALYLHV